MRHQKGKLFCILVDQETMWWQWQSRLELIKSWLATSQPDRRFLPSSPAGKRRRDLQHCVRLAPLSEAVVCRHGAPRGDVSGE